MTAPRNPDAIVSAWLEEGPTELPEMTRRAIAVDVRTTNRRRRDLVAPWRDTNVNGMTRLVLAAIAVVVAVGGGLYVFGSRSPDPSGGVGGQPPASPSGSPSSSSSAVVPEMTETFLSRTHGYSVGYPTGSTVEPASSANEDQDFIRGPGVFRASSAMAPEGVSIDDWIDEALTPADGDCTEPGATLSDIPIDGQVGRVRHGCPEEVEAMVAVGRRVYVFTLFHDGPEARAVFDAFATTIDLRPEDAVQGASPSAS